MDIDKREQVAILAFMRFLSTIADQRLPDLDGGTTFHYSYLDEWMNLSIALSALSYLHLLALVFSTNGLKPRNPYKRLIFIIYVCAGFFNPFGNFAN